MSAALICSNLTSATLLSATLLSATLLTGCGAGVTPLSLSDPRLPAEAKWRVADAQDALVVSRSQLAEAERGLREAQRGAAKAATASALGAAQAAAEGLMIARVSLASAELEYARADVERAEARLELMYAQTALQHDFEVIDLSPLTKRAEEASARTLERRRELTPARLELERASDQWWDAYLRLDQAGRAFWVSEFGR